jgi:hypothetical protein
MMTPFVERFRIRPAGRVGPTQLCYDQEHVARLVGRMSVRDFDIFGFKRNGP